MRPLLILDFSPFVLTSKYKQFVRNSLLAVYQKLLIGLFSKHDLVNEQSL